MTSDTFRDGLSRLEDHTGKKIKHPDGYWEECRHIPDQAFADIVRSICRSAPPSQGSFPTIQKLIDSYSGPDGWLDRHPEKKAPPLYELCGYCESAAPGTIEIAIPLAKPVYVIESLNCRHTIVRCGHCSNHLERNPTWPRLRRDEIEARGWTVLTQIRDISEDDGWRQVDRPEDRRSPGMQHIEATLPPGDRDEGGEIPF